MFKKKVASPAETTAKEAVIERPFSSRDDLSDITLVVDGQHLYVNKSVLSLASPVFKTLFKSEFKDKAVMPIPAKKYDDFVELLLCIYPSTNKSITRTTLNIVLPLADEYGIEAVKRRCEEFILLNINIKSPEDLIHFLYLADKYKLHKGIQGCIDSMKNMQYTYNSYHQPFAIEHYEEFHTISCECKLLVLTEMLHHLGK